MSATMMAQPGSHFGCCDATELTPVAANYRASCRARSRAEFISKLGIVEEEADESLFWLELMVDSHLVSKPRVERLLIEADQLTAIIIASARTAKRHS